MAICLALALSGCATVPAPASRAAAANRLAQANGWQAVTLPAQPFALAAYIPRSAGKAETLTVYIEGDGLAWLSPSRSSADPTPADPIGLRLAIAQPHGAAAYLARPCQYNRSEETACNPRYWTAARFAPEVIAASSMALDRLKRRFQARRLILVGYSGGGAVAALLAARRTDVIELVTVAGNLDHHAWTTVHGLSPLTASLNPANEIARLTHVRQCHFVGARDKVIPPALVDEFVNRFPPGRRPPVHVEAGFDHRCCWAANWAALWSVVQGK